MADSLDYLNDLSDAELMKIAGITPTPSAGNDLSYLESMSDEELMKIAGISSPAKEEPSYFDYASQLAKGAASNITGLGGLLGEGISGAISNADTNQTPIVGNILKGAKGLGESGKSLLSALGYDFGTSEPGEYTKTADDMLGVIAPQADTTGERLANNIGSYGLGNAMFGGGAVTSGLQALTATGVQESGGSPLVEALATGGVGALGGLKGLLKSSEAKANDKTVDFVTNQFGVSRDELANKLDDAIAIKNSNELNEYASTAELLGRRDPLKAQMSALQTSIAKEFPEEVAVRNLNRNLQRDEYLRQGIGEANLTEGDLAEALRQKVIQAEAETSKQADLLYRQVDPENIARIPIDPVRSSMNEAVDTYLNPKRGGSAPRGDTGRLVNDINSPVAIVQDAPATLEDSLSQLFGGAKNPEVIDYQTLQNLRSRSLSNPRLNNLSSEEIAVNAAIEQGTYNALEEASKMPKSNWTQDMMDKWNKAREYFRNYKENYYNNDLVKGVGGLNNSPLLTENILDNIAKSGKKNVEVLRRTVLGEGDPLLNDLRVAALDTVMDTAKGTTDSFQAASTARAYRKHGSALEGLFTPDHKARLKYIAKNTVNQARTESLGRAASNGQSITSQIVTNLDKIKQEIGTGLIQKMIPMGLMAGYGYSQGGTEGAIAGGLIGKGVTRGFNNSLNKTNQKVLRNLFEFSADPEVARLMVAQYDPKTSQGFVEYILNKSMTPALVGLSDNAE